MIAPSTDSKLIAAQYGRDLRAAGVNFAENIPLPFVPERTRWERWVALGVLALSFLYLCLFRRFTTMEPDEGIVLQGAQRILRGQVAYRDFFSFYTPGSFYLLAGLFRIFGNSLIVARTALAFSGSISSVVTYLLARRVCARSTALVTAALVTLTALPFRFLVLHNWDSTLCACLALYFAVRLVESGAAAWAFGAGSFATLTFLFEQSKGVGLLIGLGAGLIAIYFVNGPHRSINDGSVNRVGGAALAAAGLGLTWPFVATLAYFGAQHALPAMLADWIWPLKHYSAANRVPYGYQDWSDDTRQLLFGSGSGVGRWVALLAVSPCFVIPALPIVSIGLLLYWLAQAKSRFRTPAETRMKNGTKSSCPPQSPPDQGICAYYILINATIAGLLLSVVSARADIIHFMYLAPVFFLVLAWLMDDRDIPGQVFRAIRPWLNAWVGVAFLALSLPLLLRGVAGSDSLPTRAGRVTIPASDTVIPYVQAHVQPGEPLLVYPYLPLYYYLTATSNPTRYDYLQSGMNTAEQSLEMISSLETQRVDAVLFEDSFPLKIANAWPETPLSAIASDRVGDYILQHYKACALLHSPQNWRFLFMVRRNLACP